MDHIEALEERVAELEQRLADVARRQAEDNAESYKYRQPPPPQ
jgi:BMFP domain-containing protein YqiC